MPRCRASFEACFTLTANPLVARFTPASRSFNPGSYALGALWNVVSGRQLPSTLAYRAPAPNYELFSDGPHLATGAYAVIYSAGPLHALHFAKQFRVFAQQLGAQDGRFMRLLFLPRS